MKSNFYEANVTLTCTIRVGAKGNNEIEAIENIKNGEIGMFEQFNMNEIRDLLKHSINSNINIVKCC